MPPLSSILINWKTTSAGAAAFVYALGDVTHQLYTQQWDTARLHSDAVAILAGIGFLFAKDHNVTGGTTVTPPVAPKSTLSKQAWPREWVAGELDAYYGNPRGAGGAADPGWVAANLTTVTLPWASAGGRAIHVRLHRKCAASFNRIMAAAWEHAGHDQAAIHAAHIDEYDGAYVYRTNVNSPSKLSLHGYGAAIDFAAAENPNGKRWAAGGAMLPRWFIDLFLAEGWCWGGDFSGTPDAMHFQATYNRHGDAPQDQPHSLPALPPDIAQAGAQAKQANIIATVFGGAADRNTSAYDDHVITDAEPGCALPFHFPTPIPHVTVIGPRGSATVPVVDVGPIYPSPRGPADPYWLTGARPRAETDHVLSQAGIDLTPATARAVGIPGKGRVDWLFASASTPSSPATKGPAPMTDTPVLAGLPNLPSLAGLATVHNEIGAFLKIAPTIVAATSVFIPQMKVVGQALPLLQELHDFVGDLEASGGDPTKMLAAIEAHIGKIFTAAKALAPAT